MSRIDNLADSFEKHISAPWQKNIAGAQKVIFVVYPKEDERRLRIKIKEFEQRAKVAKRGWAELDFTSFFAQWMSKDEYKDEYFQHPEDIQIKLGGEFTAECAAHLIEVLRSSDENTVVAVHGVACLYGFTRLHSILQKVESDIKGRLVVLFPGSHDQNVYRLMDAKDGWNYLATPIVN